MNATHWRKPHSAPVDLPAGPSLLRLHLREQDLEEQSIALGRAEYEKQIASLRKKLQGSQRGAGARLSSRRAERTLATLIQDRLDEGDKYATQARRWIPMVGVEFAAGATVRAVQNALLAKYTKSQEEDSLSLGFKEEEGYSVEGGGKVDKDLLRYAISLRETAEDIADEIEWALKMRRWRQENRQGFDGGMRATRTSSPAFRRASMSARLYKSGVDVSDVTMGTDARQHVGTFLLDCLRLYMSFGGAPMFTRWVGKRGKGRGNNTTKPVLLVPSEKLLAVIAELDEADGLNATWKRPLVIPPRPWTPHERGGYHYALAGRYPLVRGRRPEEDGPSTTEVHFALNRLGETPWKVNRRVLRVLKVLFQMSPESPQWRKMGIGRPEEPKKPQDYDTNKIAERKHKRAMSFWHTEVKYRSKQRRSKVRRMLEVAKEFEGDPAIFFPYNCDPYGRMYPIASLLQPQGDDMARGLLEFAHGKPLGPDGAVWLAVHGANALDTVQSAGKKVKLSKLSFNDRARWVWDNTALIEAIARKPLTHVAEWLYPQGVEHWQFLAFCIEWARLQDYIREGGKEEDFISTLPVAMDASSNAIQLYSLLLRDGDTAKRTNVIPKDRSIPVQEQAPADLYMEVADAVEKRLKYDEALPTDTGRLARLWLRSGMLGRKLSKGPAMTFCYGVTLPGITEHLLRAITEDLEDYAEVSRLAELFQKEEEGKVVDGRPEACSYLANVYWAVLGAQVTAAQEVMAWLRKVAKAVTDTGRHMEWVVPWSGYMARQAYFDWGGKRSSVYYEGKRSQFRTGLPRQMDKKRERMAFAPNFVHSLDAAWLMCTLGSVPNDMALLARHDCMGCHAADASQLATAANAALDWLFLRHLLPTPAVGWKSPLVDLEAQLKPLVPPEAWPPRPTPMNTLTLLDRLLSHPMPG